MAKIYDAPPPRRRPLWLYALALLLLVGLLWWYYGYRSRTDAVGSGRFRPAATPVAFLHHA